MADRAQGCLRRATVRAMGMRVDWKRHRPDQESNMDTVHQPPPAPAGHLHEGADTSPAHENELLDEGLEESFPASDPAAVNITRIVDDAEDS
jgi:hypothetical protein